MTKTRVFQPFQCSAKIIKILCILYTFFLHTVILALLTAVSEIRYYRSSNKSLMYTDSNWKQVNNSFYMFSSLLFRLEHLSNSISSNYSIRDRVYWFVTLREWIANGTNRSTWIKFQQVATVLIKSLFLAQVLREWSADWTNIFPTWVKFQHVTTVLIKSLFLAQVLREWSADWTNIFPTWVKFPLTNSTREASTLKKNVFSWCARALTQFWSESKLSRSVCTKRIRNNSRDR